MSCVVRGICSSVRASQVLTYSSRGQMGMLPIQPGTDLPCRERGVGWHGPWLDEKICKAQRHPWEVESRSLQSDCSRLVDTAADTPGLDAQGETAPRGRSYESNAVMVGTRDISVKLLQLVGPFQTLPGTCFSDEVGENPFLGIGADQPGGVQTIWTLSCVGLPWINRGYC